MINSSDAEKYFEQIRKSIPNNNVLALRQLEALKDHVAELEYLVADLAEGLEDDDLNKRVNDILKTEQDLQDENELAEENEE